MGVVKPGVSPKASGCTSSTCTASVIPNGSMTRNAFSPTETKHGVNTEDFATACCGMVTATNIIMQNFLVNSAMIQIVGMLLLVRNHGQVWPSDQILRALSRRTYALAFI